MIDYLNVGKYCIYNKSTQTKENYILGKIIECYNNQYYVVSIGTSLECVKVYDDSLVTIIEESSNLPEALGEYFGGSSQVEEYYKVSGNDLNSLADTIITKGGTSSPLEFNSGFENAVINIPNIYTAQDEGKVVSNGALVAQTAHATVTENGTVDTTLNNSVMVSVPTQEDVLISLIDGSITAITIPDGTQQLRSYAFYQCSTLKTVGIPSSCTKINTMAFALCSNLESVNMPNITTLGQYVFNSCPKLHNLTFPASTLRLENYAIVTCNGLEYIRFLSQTPPQLSNPTSINLPLGCIIYVPSGTLSAYTSANNYPNPNTYTYIEDAPIQNNALSLNMINDEEENPELTRGLNIEENNEEQQEEQPKKKSIFKRFMSLFTDIDDD